MVGQLSIISLPLAASSLLSFPSLTPESDHSTGNINLERHLQLWDMNYIFEMELLDSVPLSWVTSQQEFIWSCQWVGTQPWASLPEGLNNPSQERKSDGFLTWSYGHLHPFIPEAKLPWTCSDVRFCISYFSTSVIKTPSPW